jgi:hypothetical protein
VPKGPIVTASIVRTTEDYPSPPSPYTRPPPSPLRGRPAHKIIAADKCELWHAQEDKVRVVGDLRARGAQVELLSKPAWYGLWLLCPTTQRSLFRSDEYVVSLAGLRCCCVSRASGTRNCSVGEWRVQRSFDLLLSPTFALRAYGCG